MIYELCIASDLYYAGRTEDGREYHAEVFYVLAEDKAGNRWSHNARFAGCKVEFDYEDGINRFFDVRPEATAAAERLLARMKAAGRINLAHWTEARPCYGSSAYEAYGQHDDIAWEKRCNEEERMGLR